MSTIFYDHLIPWQKIEVWIETLELPNEDAQEFYRTIEETIHTETLVVILTHLPQEKHEQFIDRFHAAPQDHHHLVFLKTHAHPEIETHIRNTADQVIREVITDFLNDTEEEK